MTENNIPQKQKDILNASRDLFWKYGVKRVTIEEICKHANVSKMTFYKFFPNKIELCKTIVNNIFSESIEKFSKIVHSDIPFTKKTEQLILLKLSAAKDISPEFINDIYTNPDLGLQEYTEQKGAESMNLFVEFLETSKKEGHIRKELKTEFILSYVARMQHMIEDKELMSHYDHLHDLIIEAMNFMFYGISPKHE